MASTGVAKKRKAAALSVQKNTLDRWFGVGKRAKQDGGAQTGQGERDHERAEASPVGRAPRQKNLSGASPTKTKQKGKKMVQRRILLSDQCRVCESAKSESSSRCERKCMDCEMTVHMECYGVEPDDQVLPEKWRCRPCQATHELNEPRPETDENEESDVAIRGIPHHEPRGVNGRFYGLYSSSDFAAVFLFLKRFRRLGLKLGVDVTVGTLASALLAPRDHTLLYELHTRLLQNLGATISKNGTWVDNIIRFLKSSDYGISGELVRRLAASGNANDWQSTYYDVPVADRVALLKVLCEAQFDNNDTLIERLGNEDTSPESLRDEILGVDAAKRSYYLLEDPSNFPDGAAWLCRCHAQDGSNWETVSDDLSSLQSFALALSFSNETQDLKLWQVISNGVAKSLERREKKKQQQAQRLARVPRMLRSTGLDMTSILPENCVSSGRSLRTRKAVNYRGYDDYEEDDESEPADEDHDEDLDEDQDDDDDDDDDDGVGNRADHQRRRLRQERPTRSSSRLRRSPAPSSEDGEGPDDEEEQDEDSSPDEEAQEEEEASASE